jgi:hypothetical protein
MAIKAGGYRNYEGNVDALKEMLDEWDEKLKC